MAVEYVLKSEFLRLATELEQKGLRVDALTEELADWKRMRNEAMAVATNNLARVCQLTAEVARLDAWVADLQSGMYVNCVYCGHRYGPGETTPVSMAAALRAHVEKCEKHPMSRMRDALNGMIGMVQLLSRNEDVPAELRALMTTSHRFRDAQRCFPGTDWSEYGLTAPGDENG